MAWRGFVRTIAAIVLVAATAWTGAAAEAEAPRCAGSDLVEKARLEDPAGYAAVVAAAGEVVAGDHLLWRIDSGDGTQASYLFGTIHFSDDRVTALPVAVVETLETARTVVLELAGMPEPDAVQAVLAANPQLVAMPAGTSLWDVLPLDAAAAVKARLAASGIESGGVTGLKPWLVALLLAMPQCERQRQAAGLLPVDGVVMESARRRGTPVVGLETIAEQLGVMAAMPLESQVAFLASVVDEEASPEDNHETLVQLYLGRRIGMMFPIMDLALKERPELGVAVRHFSEVLIARRNTVMVERALPLIEQGGAFIAVGAMHLPGRQGLVELLRARGYRVSPAD